MNALLPEIEYCDVDVVQFNCVCSYGNDEIKNWESRGKTYVQVLLLFLVFTNMVISSSDIQSMLRVICKCYQMNLSL